MTATALPPQLTSPPPEVPHVLVSFPAPHILLVTLNRPGQFNAVMRAQHAALPALWAWYDNQPHLRCAVLTGAGTQAFCAGADLKEWNGTHDAGSKTWNALGGFGGISNRGGRQNQKKPVIAAVNGVCLGGGMEMVLNCDLVVADGEKAKFGLPEVKVGVIAVSGALPRLVKAVGTWQRASELALLGRTNYTAEEMHRWGLVNFVVTAEDKKKGKSVVDVAVAVASELAGNSPDSVLVTREGLRIANEAGVGPEEATQMLEFGMYKLMDGGENMREGTRSFVERRKPVWKDSKL